MKTISEKIMSTEQVESETDYVICKVNECGDKRYYNAEDQLHREDGPAEEWIDGDKWWYLNDKIHREDGPAIEWVNGKKIWYLNDKKVTEETVRKLGKMK